ncbi:MAG: aldo/keto reductase, partial [Acidimicrobiales bacterium]
QAMHVVPIVSVQNMYTIASRVSESVLDACEVEGITFLPWRPIEGGEVGGTVLERVAADHGATTIQVALAWLLARSPAVLPIPGTGSLAHLEGIAAAADLKLSPAEVTELSHAGS